MHEMRTTAIDDHRRLSVTPRYVCHAGRMCKAAKRIEVLFGVETVGDQKHSVLDGDSMRPLPNQFGLLLNLQ